MRPSQEQAPNPSECLPLWLRRRVLEGTHAHVGDEAVSVFQSGGCAALTDPVGPISPSTATLGLLLRPTVCRCETDCITHPHPGPKPMLSTSASQSCTETVQSSANAPSRIPTLVVPPSYCTQTTPAPLDLTGLAVQATAVRQCQTYHDDRQRHPRTPR